MTTAEPFDVEEAINELVFVIGEVAYGEGRTPEQTQHILKGVGEYMIHQLVRTAGQDKWERFAATVRAADAQGPQNTCGGCGSVIVVGQHYLRGAAMADTAGLESILDVPELIWDGIFDTPACMALTLLRAAKDRSTTLYDVFKGY